MFKLPAEFLEQIKELILPSEQFVPAGPQINYACTTCSASCTQNCTWSCRGSCKGGCTRSCKGNSR